MCGCVPGEVLRQCSAANPDNIYVCSYVVYGGHLCMHNDIHVTTMCTYLDIYLTSSSCTSCYLVNHLW